MTGMTERVDEGSVALTPSPYGAVPMGSEGTGMFAPPAPDVATMGGAWATTFGRVVVLADAEGASCVQATSASVLASAQFSAGGAWAPFGALGRTLYGVPLEPSGQNEDVVAVTLPTACGWA